MNISSFLFGGNKYIYVLSQPRRASFHLKIRQENYFYDEESFWGAENRIWWNLVLHPFWTPLADFF